MFNFGKLKYRIDDIAIVNLSKTFITCVAQKNVLENTHSLIPVLNKLYKKYAIILEKSILSSEANLEDITTSYLMFYRLNLVICSLFSYLGDLQSEKKIINYYYDLIQKNPNIKIKTDAFDYYRYNNLLKMAVLDSEKNGKNQDNTEIINLVGEFLFKEINKSKVSTDAIVSMTLYHYINGQTDKAQEYLNMYYEKSGKNINTIEISEIEYNQMLDSETIKDYIKFIENFIKMKKEKKQDVLLRS